MTPSGQPHLSRNVSVVEQGVLQVEIITLALYYAAEMGSLFFVAPPYETALKDIKKHYPRLTVTQRIVTDPSYQNCNEWMAVSDDILARYYYRHRSRWREADMTIFLNTIAARQCHRRSRRKKDGRHAWKRAEEVWLPYFSSQG
ncbi:hypothetical protein RvY_16767-3 [Ramazzottius varieornatus]|uniref:Uncharacterized protein n=1 Tax=Ramazzottius varieornatus TaxID=947166 RepID=A0A1D1W705_RAMVA|nr:hypothetical protein RvY_16767-3 [Ramazzottius varieornatus]